MSDNDKSYFIVGVFVGFFLMVILVALINPCNAGTIQDTTSHIIVDTPDSVVVQRKVECGIFHDSMIVMNQDYEKEVRYNVSEIKFTTVDTVVYYRECLKIQIDTTIECREVAVYLMEELWCIDDTIYITVCDTTITDGEE